MILPNVCKFVPFLATHFDNFSLFLNFGPFYRAFLEKMGWLQPVKISNPAATATLIMNITFSLLLGSKCRRRILSEFVLISFCHYAPMISKSL